MFDLNLCIEFDAGLVHAFIQTCGMEAVNGCVWMKVCVISSSRCCHMHPALLLKLHTSTLAFLPAFNFILSKKILDWKFKFR